MTTITVRDDIEFDEDDTPNYYLMIAFGLGIIGLIIAANSKEGGGALHGTAVCGAVGAIFLYLFRSTFISFYKLSEYGNYVNIEFQIGWTLSLVMFICFAVCSFAVQKMDSNSSADVPLLSSNQSSPEQHSASHDSSGEQISEPPPPTAHSAGSLVTESPSQDHITLEKVNTTEPSKPSVIIYYTVNGQDNRIVVEDFPCKVGRDSSICKVPIQDSKASRIHAEISFVGEEVYITDLGSSNGTKVNGQAIDKAVELLSGDEVIIGNTVLRFEISNPNFANN